MIRLKNLPKVAFAASFIVATMLFLLVILPGSFATVSSQSGWGQINNQASLTGERLTYYRGTTAEKCQSDCGGNPNCKGFTLIRAGAYSPNDPPMCYLMSAVTSFVASTCCVSGVKSSGNGGGGSTGWGAINSQASLTGERLTFYRGTTAEKCQSDCGGNPNCKGFTLIRAGAYNANDPAMCYLMSTVTSFAPSTCCISAVKGGGSTGGGGGGGGNSVGNFAGEWDTGIDGYAFYMNLRQDGNRVTGDIDGNVGKIEGVVTGKTLRFRYTWRDSKGAGTYVLSDDGKTFNGFFSNTDNPDDKSRGYWNGRKR